MDLSIRHTILDAIHRNQMILISAQPDTTYFHWQVALYMYQFAQHGIADRCYVLFGHTTPAPSKYAQYLASKYPTIYCYRDTRANPAYIPSIRPHLLAKFFKDHPEHGKNVFYHDSDIFLIHLPRFDWMLGDEYQDAYVSDTVQYIGYDYIAECSERYRSVYPQLRPLDLLHGMCQIIGIDSTIVAHNQANSGGAQYLLKNIDHVYWQECEVMCERLYKYLCDYETTYPIEHHIQKWTTDMWACLWVYWKRGINVLVHRELDFSWATWSADDYKRLNIFHLAGITDENCADKFHKGKYTKVLVFDALLANPHIFDHIDPSNATHEYCKVIRQYTEDVHRLDIPRLDMAGRANTPDRATKPSTNRATNRATKPLAIRATNRATNRATKPSANRVVRPSAIRPSAIRPSATIQPIDPHDPTITSFKMITQTPYNGTYTIDTAVWCGGKPIWRAQSNRYIIFWTGTHWIITYAVYENAINPKMGGLGSTSADTPYGGQWNIDPSMLCVV